MYWTLQSGWRPAPSHKPPDLSRLTQAPTLARRCRSWVLVASSFAPRRGLHNAHIRTTVSLHQSSTYVNGPSAVPQMVFWVHICLWCNCFTRCHPYWACSLTLRTLELKWSVITIIPLICPGLFISYFHPCTKFFEASTTRIFLKQCNTEHLVWL